MSGGVEYDPRGLIEALVAVDDEIEATIPTGLRLGGDLVAADAKANHDYRDGSDSTLTNSIGPPTVEGSWKAGTLAMEVAAGAPHAAAIEYGAKPHKIRAKQRRALRWPGGNGWRFAVSVNHPGNRPYLYLGNAADRQMPSIAAEVQAAIDMAFIRAGLG